MLATTTTTNDVVVDNDNNDVDRWIADKLREQNNCKYLARYLIMLCVNCRQDIELLLYLLVSLHFYWNKPEYTT